jgi:hypothetical protein
MDKLSDVQALRAMQLFLEGYFERTKSDDIGSLLGDIQLVADRETADPAAWSEWLSCVTKAKTWISN